MPNDTREGALRGARLSTGITDQDTRLGFGREDHLGRGSVVNYYEDIDYSTSADNANAIRQQEKDFEDWRAKSQSAVDEYKKSLSGYQGILEDAEGKLAGGPEGAIQTAWKDLEKDFFNISVFHGYNKDGSPSVEHTYRLPKEVAIDLSTKYTGGETNYSSLLQGDTLWIDPFIMGKPYGKELHEGLANGVTDVYNQFYTKAGPGIADSWAKANNILNSGYEQFGLGVVGHNDTQGAIDSAVNTRAGSWETLRADRQRRKENMNNVLSNTKIESV